MVVYLTNQHAHASPLMHGVEDVADSCRLKPLFARIIGVQNRLKTFSQRTPNSLESLIQFPQCGLSDRRQRDVFQNQTRSRVLVSTSRQPLHAIPFHLAQIHTEALRTIDWIRHSSQANKQENGCGGFQ